jgi:hypothetical protein
MVEKFDVAAARKKAEQDIREEKIKKASGQLKTKLQQIDAAKIILANLERELEELEHEIGAEL